MTSVDCALREVVTHSLAVGTDFPTLCKLGDLDPVTMESLGERPAHTAAVTLGAEPTVCDVRRP